MGFGFTCNTRKLVRRRARDNERGIKSVLAQRDFVSACVDVGYLVLLLEVFAPAAPVICEQSAKLSVEPKMGLDTRHIVRFGNFELDTDTTELRKRGRKIHLQDQPAQVLMALLDKPGEMVTREELQERLWFNSA